MAPLFLTSVEGWGLWPPSKMPPTILACYVGLILAPAEGPPPSTPTKWKRCSWWGYFLIRTIFFYVGGIVGFFAQEQFHLSSFLYTTD